MKKKLLIAMTAIMGLSLLSGCGYLKNYSKYVTLGEYKGLEYVPASTEVTDDEVQTKIDSNLSDAKTYEDVDRAIQLNDYINLDYVGTIDGVAFDNGSTNGEGTNITVGSSGYIDDFDDQLVGHKAGDSFDVNVTFPEDYGDDNLNGKDAVFAVTINKVQVEHIPTLTETWVKENTDSTSIADYKESVKKELIADKEDSAKSTKESDVVEAAVKKATITGYRDDEVEKYVDDTITNIQTTATNYNMDYATYIYYFYGAQDEKSFETSVAEAAENTLKQQMVVTMIAKAEGISASKQEIKDYANGLVEQYSLDSVDEVYEYYDDAELAYQVIYEKVVDMLCDSAVAVDELSEDDSTDKSATTEEPSTAEVSSTEE